MPPSSPDGPGSTGQTGSLILVVEDDLRTLRLERFILEEEGFEVKEAVSGEEALEALEEGGTALVLLDLALPGIDGFTTCQRIRETSQVPIIIVTADDRDQDKVRGLELGADDYITKPFSTTELTARVKAVLRRFDFTAIANVRSTAAKGPGELGEAAPDVSSGEAGTGRTPSLAGEQADLSIYEGTVRLVVGTTGCIRKIIHFVDDLRQHSQFHLIRLVANQRREGMDILLRMREPIQLRSALLQMEDVSRVDEPSEPSTQAEERLLYVSLG